MKNKQINVGDMLTNTHVKWCCTTHNALDVGRLFVVVEKSRHRLLCIHEKGIGWLHNSSLRMLPNSGA